MSVLVTGSSGYIGKKLTLFLRKSYSVIGVDSVPDSTSTDFVTDLRSKKSFSELDRFNYSYLIHAAWDQLSANIYNNSKLLSQNIFDHAAKKEVDGIIFLSSIFASDESGGVVSAVYTKEPSESFLLSKL